MNKLDVNRLKRLPIPNLLPIFAGFRGNDLSSITDRTRDILLGSGIKNVIDLRSDGFNTRLNKDCIVWNVEYFYFPLEINVDKIIKNIDSLWELFSMLDKGLFYISCDNVFLIDIVLSCYWMFRLADKGCECPKIMGFRDEKEAGHRLSVLMTIYDYIYRELEIKNKEKPFLSKIFQSRKELIGSQYNKSCSSLTIDEKKEIIDKVQERIDEWIGRDFKIKEAQELKQMDYPFLIWNVTATRGLSINFSISKLLQVHIMYEDLYDKIETTDAKLEEDTLFNYTLEKYFAKIFPSKSYNK